MKNTVTARASDQPGSKPGNESVILEVRDLTCRFGGLVAVNQVSFQVQRDEIFGLIGPNGAGKTTVFNMLTGLIPRTSGETYFKGKLITDYRAHMIAQKGIARTFQNIRLFGSLTALDNVQIARHIHTRSGVVSGVLGLSPAPAETRQTRQRALELLDLVGLADRAEEKARNFSYGDQRRLEIARALAMEPELLLLDEPAAGMNPNEKHLLSEFIRDIRKRFNLTVILIEHYVPLVMGLCDRIAVLNFGQLIALGNPAHVQNDPAVIEAYLGD